MCNSSNILSSLDKSSLWQSRSRKAPNYRELKGVHPTFRWGSGPRLPTSNRCAAMSIFGLLSYRDTIHYPLTNSPVDICEVNFAIIANRDMGNFIHFWQFFDLELTFNLVLNYRLKSK